jgi:hypothetical protein
MKLRVPGNYTGEYGTVPFENGVSTRLVSPREANLLRAIMTGVEVLQDDGETVDEVLNAMFPILPLGNYLDAGTEPPSPYLTQWDGTYPPKPDAEAIEAVVQAAPEAQKQVVAAGAWTREALEAVADEKGINGLRAIGEPVGVKGRSIPDLITAILEAQAKG